MKDFDTQAIPYDPQFQFKHASQLNHMMCCPIGFRGANGAAADVAAQHSQEFSACFAHCRSLKVSYPFVYFVVYLAIFEF
ncbi:hypothetical protein ANCDUO_13825 [Ancylostoma duodenale]|uniref:Uncharacterized protein n=1 Tax=Ancylostoma duodenale TaxID=51022 RepID=A0A0C2D1V2_9BILA|nr:hypothetical protein ANCDUO_13825 [Ancylostoma duodenale]